MKPNLKSSDFVLPKEYYLITPGGLDYGSVSAKIKELVYNLSRNNIKRFGMLCDCHMFNEEQNRVFILIVEYVTDIYRKHGLNLLDVDTSDLHKVIVRLLDDAGYFDGVQEEW